MGLIPKQVTKRSQCGGKIYVLHAMIRTFPTPGSLSLRFRVCSTSSFLCGRSRSESYLQTDHHRNSSSRRFLSCFQASPVAKLKPLFRSRAIGMHFTLSGFAGISVLSGFNLRDRNGSPVLSAQGPFSPETPLSHFDGALTTSQSLAMWYRRIPL